MVDMEVSSLVAAVVEEAQRSRRKRRRSIGLVSYHKTVVFFIYDMVHVNIGIIGCSFRPMGLRYIYGLLFLCVRVGIVSN